MKKMKGKMWCLISKKTGKIMAIGEHDARYVIGYNTRKGLVEAIGVKEYDEEIRKIEFRY